MKFQMLKTALCSMIIANSLLITMAHAQNSVTNNNDFSRWAAYGNSIKNCTPGTFLLPDAIKLAMLNTIQQSGGNVPAASVPPLTYQIIGWQSGVCQLKITMTVPSETNVSQPSSITMNCAISQQDLPKLSDSAAKIASGTFTTSTDDTVSKIMESSCKQASQ